MPDSDLGDEEAKEEQGEGESPLPGEIEGKAAAVVALSRLPFTKVVVPGAIGDPNPFTTVTRSGVE